MSGTKPSSLLLSSPSSSSSLRRSSSSPSRAFFWTLCYCISISFLLQQPSLTSAAYIVSIPAKDEECYLISSPPGSAGGTLNGNFDHLDEVIDSEPLSVVIIDSNEEHVLFRSRRRATEGVFRVNLKPDQKVNLSGRGRKSPSGRSHDGLERTVGFEYTVEGKDEKSEIHTQNEKNTKAAAELHKQIHNLINHFSFMKLRESKHREVVETTFTQLMWWVILEAIFVVLVACAQIMYFRNFLERRRYM
ncbi:hypothetical protein FRACYDRAFT_238615 [Fragilariopsis cylindrus CCMP1102]|uniref:GOLD domain-containing protein n=1 Tax=Fragilariopsis cylindrus CCMP1102 TaxID=635003 RepID=A0A1E7FD06_9STRA|nr:hypothetical protein FRACYDRAFT_238615 [Fragilariopsis cylindrus CCMP1102]|eukprot:OEU16031.1 hypothetical protein FRACYDRAFT_238615 [Fragilariopsis cylindrus CCMP1102]